MQLKARTSIKSAGKKDNDTTRRDTGGITRGDVAAEQQGLVEKEEQKRESKTNLT
jgi:hypothetical protein